MIQKALTTGEILRWLFSYPLKQALPSAFVQKVATRGKNITFVTVDLVNVLFSLACLQILCFLFRNERKNKISSVYRLCSHKTAFLFHLLVDQQRLAKMTDNSKGYIGVFELKWTTLKALIRPRGKFKKDKQSDFTQKESFFPFPVKLHYPFDKRYRLNK